MAPIDNVPREDWSHPTPSSGDGAGGFADKPVANAAVPVPAASAPVWAPSMAKKPAYDSDEQRYSERKETIERGVRYISYSVLSSEQTCSYRQIIIAIAINKKTEVPITPLIERLPLCDLSLPLLVLQASAAQSRIGTQIGTGRIRTGPDQPDSLWLTGKKRARKFGLKLTMQVRSVCPQVV